jgi:HlyD family secretion protein
LTIQGTSEQDTVLSPKSRNQRTLRWIVAIVIVTCVIGWLGYPVARRWSRAEASVPRERLRVATVTRGDFVRDVSVQGRIVSAMSPTLYATQAGTITFHVEVGARVQLRQELADIDSPEVRNQLQQEESAYKQFEVELERHRIESKQQKLKNQKTVDLASVAFKAADREKRRAELAFGNEVMSQIDLEKARDDLLNAELAREHAAADANLDNERLDFELRTKQLEAERQALMVDDLRRQVDALTIRSPVSGIVGNLLVDQKTTVTRNQAVLSVVDLSQFEVEVQVPESYADDLAIGMAAEIHAGNQQHVATLVSISPEIIEGQVTGRVRFDGDSPSGLRQNQRLTTRILLESKDDVLMVSRGRFLDSGGGRIAYVVDGDLATRRSIKVGARSLGTIEVLSGLELGENIIVSGTELFDGAEAVLITD